MAIEVVCPGCRSTLHIREENAGKEMQCPRCSAQVKIPASGRVPEEAIQEVLPVSSRRPVAATRKCPKCGAEIAQAARKCHHCKTWLEDEEEDEDDEAPRRSPYKPCPRCQATD